MDIDRPGARALSSEEEALLEQFRQKLHAKALQGGLSPEDVQRVIAGIKEQPNLAPGQRLLRLDG